MGNPQTHRVRGIVWLVLLAACSSPAPSETPASLAPPDGPRNSALAPATAAVEASAAPAAPVMVDKLAQIAIGGLSVRIDPSIAAERVGILPHPQTVFVLAGPVQADGYTWYQLGSLGIVSVAECVGEILPFQCTTWVGWAAGITPEGDQWVVPFEPVVDCPPGRDTTTYLSLDALTRLACAGDDEWRLVAYVAPPGGRGCFSAWMVDPGWMSCARLFPQPVESELDGDSSLAVFIPPELGECGPGCPWDELTGSWVEVVGHLDDPVAKTCAYVLNSQFVEAPSPPPDPDLAVFGCRLNFVVTELTATTPPTP